MAAVFRSLGLFTRLAALLLIAGCSGPETSAPLACTAVQVVSPEGPLTGIEDISHGPGEHIIVSAYSRKSPQDWPAGLFHVAVSKGKTTWHAKPALVLGDGSWPHGFAWNSARETLAVIVRRDGAPPRLGLYKYGKDELRFERWLIDDAQWDQAFPYPCNMNDAAFLEDDALLLTNDRRRCGGFLGVVDTLAGKKDGSLLKVWMDGRVEEVARELYFPNGVAVRSDGQAVVVQTRALQVAQYPDGKVWDVQGAPDNIAVDAFSQGFWVAFFGSLPRYAAYQRGILPGSLGSGVAYISPGLTDVTYFQTLDFDGATSVMAASDVLILSGAFTDGVAVCDRPDV